MACPKSSPVRSSHVKSSGCVCARCITAHDDAFVRGSASVFLLCKTVLSGLVAPMSIDHGSKVTPIKAGPMAELAAMREQYANSGGVPPPPGAPTLPGEGHHCSARVLLSCGASQARAWLS